MSTEPPRDNSQLNQAATDSARQAIIASEGSTIHDVVQAFINNPQQEVHVGPKIYLRSDVEELQEYLDWAMSEFENRMAGLRLDSRQIDKPYKFLDYFEPEDAPIFFGRGAASAELFDRVVGNRIMILYGRSGAGKSSILNAGLSPLLLMEDRLPIYVRIYPYKENIVREVKEALFPSSQKPWPRLLDNLSLHEFLGLAARHRNRRTRELVVIFDQFEQFLISVSNEKIRISFIEALRNCYEDRTLPVRFVISLQHENLGDLDEFEKYIPLILQNRYSLLPMSEAEVQDAITGPVQQVNNAISFEPALLAGLIQELGGKNVELTHLQIVCDQLYDALPDGQQVITRGLYEELGRVDKILTTYLGKTLEPLPDYKHKVARIILKELVSSEGTNRILSLPELSRSIPPDPSVLEEVLQYLVNNRLLRRGTSLEEKQYELAHAYLVNEISHWIGKDELDNKRAQDLLQRELVNWRLFHILIDSEELQILQKHITYLSLDQDAREMLLYSSLEQGHNVDFWIEQMEDRNAAARLAATFAMTNEKVAEHLEKGLAKDLRADVLAVLWQVFNHRESPQRHQAAESLWLFQDWLSPDERRRIRLFLLPVRIRQGVQHNARPLLVTALFGIPLLVWFLFFMERPIPGNWVLIEHGEFTMGMNLEERKLAFELCDKDALRGVDGSSPCVGVDDLIRDSGEQENASLPDYQIMENEVTNAQYQQCYEAGGCTPPADWNYASKIINQPVARLNWYQAGEYCAWLGGRLPTEGEWEKAARGPMNNIFPWGNTWDPSKANIKHKGLVEIQDIDVFAKTDSSGYGIKNMAGNIQEWTASDVVPITPGQTFTNDLFQWDGQFKNPPVIVRGGSWQSEPSLAMAASRQSYGTDDADETIGFRCVCPNVGSCQEPWNWLWFLKSLWRGEQ